MEQKFYICKHCGNIIAKIKDIGVPVICCGEPMSEIVPRHHRCRRGEARPRLDGGKRYRPCQGRLRGASHAAGALHRVGISRPSRAISARNCIPAKSRRSVRSLRGR